MENPYVDCIGHLTGRKIRTRGPRDVDVERVVAKAVETGDCLEINSQPDRLDLPDVHARAAKEAGVKIVVKTDAHRIRAQGYVELGVAQARRAWLTKDDVLNTRTWAQVEKLRRKRRDLPRGRARRDRLGGALSRAGRRAAGAGAGRAGRALGEAAAVAAGGGRAVRERAARPRRADRPGDDELAASALLRVLRGHRLRARHPRRAARGDDEPGGDPLADVAGVDRAGAADGRLGRGSCSGCRTAGTGTSRTPRRPRRSPR